MLTLRLGRLTRPRSGDAQPETASSEGWIRSGRHPARGSNPQTPQVLADHNGSQGSRTPRPPTDPPPVPPPGRGWGAGSPKAQGPRAGPARFLGPTKVFISNLPGSSDYSNPNRKRDMYRGEIVSLWLPQSVETEGAVGLPWRRQQTTQHQASHQAWPVRCCNL